MNVYRKAIEVIKERGRGQISIYNPVTGTVCLVGALTLAKGKTIDELEAYSRTGLDPYEYVDDICDIPAAFIRDNYGYKDTRGDVDAVYQFNDDHTDTDVILVLEKAAIQWDELNGN